MPGSLGDQQVPVEGLADERVEPFILLRSDGSARAPQDDLDLGTKSAVPSERRHEGVRYLSFDIAIGHDICARARLVEAVSEKGKGIPVEERRFDDEWRAWMRLNVDRGCSKDGIFQILIDEGFPYDAIRNELGHEPSISGSGLARHFLPNATRVATTRADVYVVDDFLDAAECTALAAIVRSGLRPSTITNPDEPDTRFRTSRTCDLSAADGDLVQEIDGRICRYLGINPSYAEPLQGQHYDVGEEFKAHTDYFEAHELEEFGGTRGQRTWTMMVYLTVPELGGETRFVRLGATITPQRGRAVVWNNQYPDGTPNPDTMHHGMPVRAGCKTILTKWFRERGDG